MKGARAIGRVQLVVVSLVAIVFGMGPTVGDVGGCGRTASDLDEHAFQSARKTVDCRRCKACGLTTMRCSRACDKSAPPDVGFPSTCHPLLHDGEACLDALLAASCDDYAGYVDDVAPTTPSECDFCRIPFAEGGAE